MRIVYGLIGVAFLLAGLVSCTTLATGGTSGAVLTLIGFLCLFAGDALHLLQQILEQLRQRSPPPD